MGKYLDKIRQHERTQPEEASTPPQDAESIVIDPAAENPRPVYWERGDLSIVGPGRPEFLAKVGDGLRATYWVVAQFQGVPVWINSIMLRSEQAFEQQAKTAHGAGPCFACGTNRRWVSVHGAIICGTCHPPVDDSLVKHWIGPEGQDRASHEAQPEPPGVIDGDGDAFDVGPP